MANSTPTKYPKIHTFINRELALLLIDVTINENSNSTSVVTNELGYAGEGPGAPTTDIDFKSAVGMNDFETWVDNLGDIQFIEVQAMVGGRQFANTCSVIKRSLSGANGQVTTCGYTLKTGPLNWQKVA